MVAAGNLEDAASVRECPLLNVLHPGTVHGEGNVVFRLTGYGAGVAADALAVIDDKSVSHAKIFSAPASKTRE